MKLIFYDFEVFCKDWLVVFIEYETKEKTIVINDKNKLQEVYDKYKDDIFCGYNSRNYDMVIFKGILQGLDPYLVNNQIIVENKKAYQILDKKQNIQFNNFDLVMLNKSLKQLEGFMGSTIKESDVDFNIARKLTTAEIQETLKYCTHDVEQTMLVFENVKEEFDSQLSLITAFELPMEMFNKTKAQISSKILDAKRTKGRGDEFDISYVDTLRISDKYQYIVDWYNDPKNRNYKRSLTTNVAGVPHVFGWGGIHGAIPKYKGEGIILCMDIASMYPAIIIEYDFMSRNVSDRNKYREIRDTRLKLKKEKNPMQAPYKIVLNSTFGATKDEMNDLYDPLMANNICINGQLLLLDLIEKIEPYGQLIQSNTDGIFMQVEDMDKVEIIKKVASEWEKRTRLDLEWDIYTKIYQKDVNNYIIIDKDGNYKSKGSYVKQLNNIDYDLPIINKALISYFIDNKPVKDTILDCNELKEFQKIIKITSLFKYALHGTKPIKEKVLRVFASNDENASGIYKVKSEEKADKIANTPDKCFIWNDNVNGVNVTPYLDKEYYIDLAEKRLNDFLVGDAKKAGKPKSEIKGVNHEVKLQIESIDLDEYDFFIDLLVCLSENKIATKSHIPKLTKLNYFDKFGGNKKLSYLVDEFYDGKNKYVKTLKDESKLKRINSLKKMEQELEDEIFSLEEQMQFEIDLLGYLQIGFDIPKNYCYVMDLDLKFSPRANLYCLSNLSYNKSISVKIPKKQFNKQQFKVGDIICGKRFYESYKSKPDPERKGKFITDETEKEWWLDSYVVVNDLNKIISNFS